MTERMVMVEQRGGAPGDGFGGRDGDGNGAAAPFILDRHGRRTEAHDDARRTRELRAGLTRDGRVVALVAGTDDERLQQILAAIHEPEYLRTLRAVDWEDPRIVPELAPPGLPADSPLWAAIVDVAFEGARVAVAAADALAGGERFAYALSRPPGHHAGPAWLGGYCYLNTAGAAAQALCERGLGPVAIVDVDFHFPTGTSAIVAPLEQVSLGSLHASTLAEVPWREVRPGQRERFVGFDEPPGEAAYLQALAAMLEEFAGSCSALVLSLGYDTVDSDPHGSWRFTPATFERIGALVAGTGLPVCVVQEGGYSLAALAECAGAFATGLLDGASIQNGSAPDPQAGAAAAARRAGDGRLAADGLAPFRARLDELDEQIARLLGERFDVCRAVARHKSEHDIPMMQPERVRQVRERYLARGEQAGLPSDFTQSLFELLIGATCRLEDELIAELDGSNASAAVGDGSPRR